MFAFRRVGSGAALRYLLPVTWESVWNVLKWVLAALVAGFIGQFGRSYALRLIERRRKTSVQAEAISEGFPTDVQLERDRLETQAKIEKKRAKAEVKRLKKQANSEEENDG